MKHFPISRPLLGGIVIVGTVALFAVGSSQVQPVITKSNATIKALMDPMERMKARVDDLEKKVETLEKESKALKKAVGPIPDAVEKANYLYSEFQKPGGVQGVRRKIYQKSFWGRIPDGAYIIVYER